MIWQLGSLALLFAQAGDAAPAAGGGAGGGAGDGSGGLIQFLPFLVIMGLLYFMFLRPQMQQEKKRQEMLKTLKKNDKVVTSAGMYGTVISVDEGSDRVVLKVGEDDKGTRIAFTRASIVKILGGDKAERAEEPAKS
ncbi:MAG: preprotein translocase subunit YajC [Isosphaeraceae bacterium]